jgi:uncharacterized protein (TIGR03437 family)
LDKLRLIIFTFLLGGLVGTQIAAAQTAANITVLSGNGQITCQVCNTNNKFFLPLVVKVTDANGQPIANKTVTWTLLSVSGGATPNFLSQTVTDANGITSTFFSQSNLGGSFGLQFLQTSIQASVDAVSAIFYETQDLGLSTVLGQGPAVPFITAQLVAPDLGTILQGTAGGTSSTTVQVHVAASGAVVPNASVRLLNGTDPTTAASVACATGAGADPGAVLTDANGNATCTPVFGAITGANNFTVLVGGVDPATSSADVAGTTVPVAYFQLGPIGINVAPGVPGMLTISSGNNQSVNPGQQTAPLVVKVTDSTGANTIAGASVVWTVSPAGAVTFNPATSVSGTGGLAQTVATLSSSAVGAITIKAALASQSSISASFTITANVALSGLQKVSGDQQSAPAGQAFSQPLVVQVNGSNGQPIANYPVSFTVSGPATLSAASATTGSDGRAQVTATASTTQGAVTVTATAGSFTQSFSLTVIPPGPSLTTSSFLNGADFKVGSLSPCGIATIIGSGIASTVQGVVLPSSLYGPLPYTLAGVKVTFANSQAPIYNVANVNNQQQVTVQVPCDVTPGSSVAVAVSVSGGSATINIPILIASPGVFQTTMSDGVQRLVAVRPDGSFVSLENPARRGEIIRAYVTGLGPVSPSVATNSIAVPGTDSTVTGQVIVGVNNAGTRLVSARVAPSLIGIDEVAFQVPSDAPTGNDIVFSVGINAVGDTQTRFSAGSKIPIQ